MVHFEKLTEAEVITRIQSGEKSLFEIIVRRLNPYLYKVGRGYGYTHDDTQDLMQETFMDAYKNLHQFEGRSSFKTWMIRIMLNNCYRKRKKSSFKNELAMAVNDNSKPVFTNSSNDANKVVQNHEVGHVIEEALARVPLDYRIVFSLREINGLNVSETADVLNISESNVKVRLNRSKAILRTEIEKTYSASELFELNLIYCDGMVERVMKGISELDRNKE